MPSDQASAARTAAGRYLPGTSGNPRGRPRGSGRGLAARLDRLVAAAAEGIVAGLVERAKAGDADAAAVLLRRPWAGSEASP